MDAQCVACTKKHINAILLLDSGTAGSVSTMHDQTWRRLHVALSTFQLVTMSLNLLVDSSRVRPAVRRGCVVPANPCVQFLSASHVGESMEHATSARAAWRKAAPTKPAFAGDVELILGLKAFADTQRVTGK